MHLIEEWKATLARSYTAWLGYVAAICTAMIGIVQSAPPQILSAAHAGAAVEWLTWFGLIAGTLVPLGRILAQPGVPGKQ